MDGKPGQTVLWLVAVAALACSLQVQAFSFCFSFGSNHHRYSPYNRYVPPYPPAQGVYYPENPDQLQLPGIVYPPEYPLPPLQPYGVLIPVQTGE
jgi:hypothetical protein